MSVSVWVGLLSTLKAYNAMCICLSYPFSPTVSHTLSQTLSRFLLRPQKFCSMRTAWVQSASCLIASHCVSTAACDDCIKNTGSLVNTPPGSDRRQRCLDLRHAWLLLLRLCISLPALCNIAACSAIVFAAVCFVAASDTAHDC